MLDVVKVGGARWQGTKTRLGDDSDAEEQEESKATGAAGGHPQAGLKAAGSEGSEDTHVSSHSTDKSAAARVDPQSLEHTAAAPGEGETVGPAQRRRQPGRAGGAAGLAMKRSLLRRLAVSVLKAAGGQLRVKKLEKRVLDAVGLPRGGHQRRQARRQLGLALQKKPRFSMLGDEAVLVP